MMAHNHEIDEIAISYKKIQQIVNEVTRKYGTDLVLNQPRPIDEITL